MVSLGVFISDIDNITNFVEIVDRVKDLTLALIGLLIFIFALVLLTLYFAWDLNHV